ncbi:MAG: NupC/NupG family nucleoside CNT transporter [Brevinema sp.]
MRFMGILGIVFFVGIAVLFSKNRKAINLRTVIWGFGLQIIFALIMLGSPILSFVAAGILLALIFVYVALTNEKSFSSFIKLPKPALGIASVLKLTAIIAIGYLMGVKEVNGTLQSAVTPFIHTMWIVFIVACVLKRYIKNATIKNLPIVAGIFLFNISLSFGGMMAVAFATNFEQSTMTHLLATISNGFADFLMIPTSAGAEFIYGPLADVSKSGFIFFIQVLSSVVFFSAFISILYFLGIIQVFVAEMAKFMRWTMLTSGAETLSCSANIFVGQTEAPILVKPFIPDMTESELHAIMTGGFATISGGVLAGFVAFGIDPSYLLGASTMSAPASLMISKIWYPETQHSKTEGDAKIPDVQVSDNLIGAAAMGTSDGVQLAINIGGMLLSFIALIKVLNMGLDFIVPGMTLEMILGNIFQYLAIIMGVPLQDAKSVGTLLGFKVALNEFVAYLSLSEMQAAGVLSPKSIVISTYALCGFANFSSIAIQVGGLAYMAPNRRNDIARLGLSAMICGAFASWITACIAGIMLG